MKRCPECKRDYFDDTLTYCLDDGNVLLEGPRATEAVTAIYSSDISDGVSETNPSFTGSTLFKSRNLIFFSVVVLLMAASFAAYKNYVSDLTGTNSSPGGDPAAAPAKLYWKMTEAEQLDLVRQRAAHISSIIGDTATELTDEEISSIKSNVDHYVQRKDSLSQEPFKEGLRVIYGRASQYAPLIANTFNSRKVPAVLGIYQAMIESEYRDCPTHPHPRGPVGLFQFSRKTAELYKLEPADYCNIEKQADAAANHMSDLLSDFGTEKSSWTLALMSFNIGSDGVREYLREIRQRGIVERDFWAIRRNQKYLSDPPQEDSLDYVLRFIAAAIIGENPGTFGLPIPPLTALAA